MPIPRIDFLFLTRPFSRLIHSVFSFAALCFPFGHGKLDILLQISCLCSIKSIEAFNIANLSWRKKKKKGSGRNNVPSTWSGIQIALLRYICKSRDASGIEFIGCRSESQQSVSCSFGYLNISEVYLPLSSK